MRKLLHAIPLMVLTLLFCMSAVQLNAQCPDPDFTAGALVATGPTEACPGDYANVLFAFDGAQTAGLDPVATGAADGYGINIDLTAAGVGPNIPLFGVGEEGITLADIETILLNNMLTLTPGTYTIQATFAYSGADPAVGPTSAECYFEIPADYTFTVLDPNDPACAGGDIEGCTDPDAINFDPAATIDDGSCQFAMGCEDGQVEVVINYTVDQWASEVSWELIDDAGTVVASVECGSLADDPAGQSLTEIVCVAPGGYTLNLYDDFGDGWIYNGPQGGLTITVDGEFVGGGDAQNGVVGDEAPDCVSDLEFTQCLGLGVIAGCTDAGATNFNADATYDCGGCLFAEGSADECADATMVELPGATGLNVYGPYDGGAATLSDSDPAFADCLFPEGDVYSNTQWFSFEGDGNTYVVYTSNACEGDTLDQASWDSQMVIFTGECGTLEEVACNEDLADPAYVSDTGADFEAGVNITTEAGVTYYVLIDGYEAEVGNYCLRIAGATECTAFIEPGPEMPTVIDFNPQCGSFFYSWNEETLDLGYEWAANPATELMFLVTSADPMGANPLTAGALFVITATPDGTIELAPGTPEGLSPYATDSSTLYFTLIGGAMNDAGNFNVVGNACQLFATTTLQVNYLATDEPCPDTGCAANGGTLTAPANTDVPTDGMNEAPVMEGGSDGGGFVYTYILVDADGNIIGDSDVSGVFDFTGLPEGDYTVWGLSVEGGPFDILGLLGNNTTLEMLQTQTDACATLSDAGIGYSLGGGGGCEAAPSEVTTMSETTFCTDDDEDDLVDITIAGGVGENVAVVITDAALNILAVDPTASTTLNFSGNPAGTCLIWVVHFDSLEGAEAGANAADLTGCFALSNSIEIVRTSCVGCDAEPSVISTESETTFCTDDGEDDLVDVTIEGGVGTDVAFVITDEALNILAINPEVDSSLNFEGVPAGTCLIWAIHFNTLEGAEVGANAADLGGCFGLSNSIEVVRTSCNGCEAAAASISTADATAFCTQDGIDDLVNVNIDEAGAGENTVIVITDEALNILAINPELDAALNFEGNPLGTCLIWVLNFDSIEGADVGANAADLAGCFALSNSIAVTRVCDVECTADAGTLNSFDDFACGGAITISTEGADDASALVYVLTDTDLNILALSLDGNFEGLPSGEYLPHALSLDPAEVPADPTVLIGMNAAAVLATLNCFDLVTADGVFQSLDPIMVNVDYDCDDQTGIYTLTISFSGGLPELDPSETYTSSESLSGEFFFGENTVLEFAENSSYNIIAEDNSGCAAGTDAGTPDPCTKLAIELTSFDAREAGDNNLVSWDTATEVDNDYFELYTSVDGIDFELLTTVNAVGNSNTISIYEHMHVDAPQVSTVYYQLVAVSVNGQMDKSTVITVERDTKPVVTGISPVPATNFVNIDMQSTRSGLSTVEVFDVNGRLISSIDIEIIEGINRIGLDINDFAAGVYIFSIQTGDAALEGRFVKH